MAYTTIPQQFTDGPLATVYGPLLLIVPLIVGANLAQYRSHALLLPLALPLRHLRPPIVAGLAVLAIPLAFTIAALYLTRVLV